MSFMKANLTIKTEDIGVICPYLRQCQAWLEALAKIPELKGITVFTADSMKGRERDFMFYDITVSSNVGSSYSFLADSRHLCISLTRRKKGFVIIRDS